LSKVITPPVPLPDIIDKCKERIREYPVDTVEYRKIKHQIEMLENELSK